MEYHFVITVESPLLTGGRLLGTYSGVITPDVDRRRVFNAKFNEACERLGSDPQRTFVLHWSLEQNDL